LLLIENSVALMADSFNNQNETNPLACTNSASLIPVIFFNSSFLFF